MLANAMCSKKVHLHLMFPSRSVSTMSGGSSKASRRNVFKSDTPRSFNELTSPRTCLTSLDTSVADLTVSGTCYKRSARANSLPAGAQQYRRPLTATSSSASRGQEPTKASTLTSTPKRAHSKYQNKCRDRGSPDKDSVLFSGSSSAFDRSMSRATELDYSSISPDVSSSSDTSPRARVITTPSSAERHTTDSSCYISLIETSKTIEKTKADILSNGGEWINFWPNYNSIINKLPEITENCNKNTIPIVHHDKIVITREQFNILNNCCNVISEILYEIAKGNVLIQETCIKKDLKHTNVKQSNELIAKTIHTDEYNQNNTISDKITSKMKTVVDIMVTNLNNDGNTKDTERNEIEIDSNLIKAGEDGETKSEIPNSSNFEWKEGIRNDENIETNFSKNEPINELNGKGFDSEGLNSETKMNYRTNLKLDLLVRHEQMKVKVNVASKMTQTDISLPNTRSAPMIFESILRQLSRDIDDSDLIFDTNEN